MSKKGDSTQKQTPKTSRLTWATLVLGTAAIAVMIIYALYDLQTWSGPEAKFYHVDKDGLYWDYEALSKSYDRCRNSMRMTELHNIMVKARASHLVPQIIDSIPVGGFMDTEKKICTIILLTGHDFAKEFDIKGIWGQSEVNNTKLLLHQWWQQNSKEVLKHRGPKERFNLPNHWPSLSLELKTEKKQYIQAEPIRSTVILSNNSDTWFTFTHKPGKPAFQIEYYRILDDGNMVDIAKTSHPAKWHVCGNTSKWFTKPRRLVIDAGSYITVQQCLNIPFAASGNSYDGKCFEPGEITIRAVLTPLRGDHKGKQLKSNDLTINILEPQDCDGEVYSRCVLKDGNRVCEKVDT